MTAEASNRETIASVVEDWFFKSCFFPSEPTKIFKYNIGDIFQEVVGLSEDLKSSDTISQELRDKILTLSNSLAVLSDNHLMTGRLAKAENAAHQAYILNKMLPIQKRDIERINIQLRIAVMQAKIAHLNQENLELKLTENAQFYQRPGVDHYLLMLYYFCLIVNHLKEGNSVQFHSRCKILKDLLCRNFQLKFTTEPESFRISQVISMKLVKGPLNYTLYKSIVCLAVLFEWLNRRMTGQADPKLDVLLKNTQVLAADCDPKIAEMVSKIEKMVEEQLADNEEIDKKLKGSNISSKFGTRKYFIKVQDFEASKLGSQTRPTSATKAGIHKRNLSGSTPAQQIENVMSIYVPAAPVDEDSTDRYNQPNYRSNSQRVVDHAQGTYRLVKRGGSGKKVAAKGALGSRTARTLSLHSILFEKPSLETLAQKAIEAEQPSEPTKPDFLEEYKEYSANRKLGREGSLSLTARTAHPIVSKVAKKKLKKDKIPLGAVINKFAPVSTYGAYYLGIHTLQKHTPEPLVVDVDKNIIQNNMFIIEGNNKKTNFKVIEADLSPIVSKGNSPHPFGGVSPRSRFRMRSKESFDQFKGEKIENKMTENNLFKNFAVLKPEALLLKRPSSTASVNKITSQNNQTIGQQNLVAKTSFKNSIDRDKPRASNKYLASQIVGDVKNDPKQEVIKEEKSKSMTRNSQVKTRRKHEKEECEPKANMKLHQRRTTEVILSSRDKRLSIAESIYRDPSETSRNKRRFTLHPFVHNTALQRFRNRNNEEILLDPKNEKKNEHPFRANVEEEPKGVRTYGSVASKKKSDSIIKEESKSKLDSKALLNKSSEIFKTEGQNELVSMGGFDKLSDKGDLSSSIVKKNSRQSNVQDQDDHQSSALKPSSNNPDIKQKVGSARNNIDFTPRRNSKLKVETLAIAATGLISTFKDVLERRGSLAVHDPRARSGFIMKTHGGKTESNMEELRLPLKQDISSVDDEESNKSSILGGDEKKSPNKSTFHRSFRLLAKSPDNVETKINNILNDIDGDKQIDSELNQAINESYEEDIYTKAKRDLILNGFNNFDKSFNVKEDLLKFVQGFHKLKSQIEMATQNTLRMSLFVLRFYGDAVFIQKPRKGLEFHKSMLNYNEEYLDDPKEELKWKPWKRRYSQAGDAKTIEHCFPKIQFKEQSYTFMLHKQNSCLNPCKKTSIKLINSRLAEEQPLVMFYEHNARRGKILVAVNKKWGNQLYSKKGIGSWLNMAFFLKNNFEEIDLDEMESIWLDKKKAEKTAYDNIYSEKNKLVLRLFIHLLSRTSILVRTLVGGFKVMLAEDKIDFLRDNVLQLSEEKERLRLNTKRWSTLVSKDKLSEMYFLKRIAEEEHEIRVHEPIDQSEDEDFPQHVDPLEFFGAPENFFLNGPITPIPKRRRRRSRRQEVKPQNNFLISPIPEAIDSDHGILVLF